MSNNEGLQTGLLYRDHHRWLFLIEGGLTCIIATTGSYLIPDFPSTPASWLTHEEQLLAQRRMTEDLCRNQKETQKIGFVEVFTDWTIWWLAIARSMATVGESFESYFPTLVATMGYDPSTTLLLCAPPWIFAMTVSFYVPKFVVWLIVLLIVYISPFQAFRRYKGPFLAHCCHTLCRYHWVYPRDFVNEPYYPLLLFVSRAGFFRGFLFDTCGRHLIAQSDVSHIVFFAWVSNSISETSKRAIAIAFVNTCSTGVANTGAA